MSAGPIVDYASLSQAILDWTHRTSISPYVDYFIQEAQSAIERDIPDLNFGNYVRAQEVSYGPFSIANGVCPVPSDWLGAKALQIGDFEGDLFTLIVKDPQWIYSNYPQRNAQGPPSYVARDIWQQTYAQPQNFTATAGQTVFNLGATPSTSSLMLVTLSGASLSLNVDYTLSGATLTLMSGAIAGQVLSVNYLATSTGIQTWSTAAGQTSFALNNSSLSVIAATLNGAVLSPTTDYVVAGGYITLTGAPYATVTQQLNATLTAGVTGPYLGYGNGQFGSMSPTVDVNGNTIEQCYYGASSALFVLTISSTSVLTQGYFSEFLINGQQLTSSAANFYIGGGNTYVWEWSVNPGLINGSQYDVLMYSNISIPAPGVSATQGLTAYLSTGSVLIFGPYPDAAYTVQGTYYGRAPRLSSTQTQNWMVSYIPNILLDACMREAAMFIKDAQMYQLWDQRYQAKLKAFVDQDKAERWAAATMQVDTA